MLLNNTSLSIGPLTFTHQVQKINLQERKGVNVIEATRSKKNFIVDSGDSDAKAQIRLLFTGLDEINGSISFRQEEQKEIADYSVSGLRALIALFKCCPIVTLKNNYISASWKKADKIYNESNYRKLKQYLEELTQINRNVAIEETLSSGPIPSSADALAVIQNQQVVQLLNERLNASRGQTTPDILKGVGQFTDYSFGSVNFPDSFLQQNVTYSDNISIALESLELENVPDIPYAIQVTLTISRVDTAPFTRGGELEYLGSGGIEDARSSPADAYWLKKWIYTILEKGEIPELRKSDFSEAYFAWYGNTAIGTPITDKPVESFKLKIGEDAREKNTYGPALSSEDSLLVSENASLRHRFAYNKIVGKIFPTAVHMGSSGRFMSMDIVFNNQRSYDAYKAFCKFKYTADEINKERERFDRVSGWQVSTPITKLLSSRRNPLAQQSLNDPYAGVYVPISIITENGDQPDMINCRIDLVENNIDYYSDNEIVLEEGSGTDYADLKKYYDNIANKEIELRTLLLKDKQQAINNIIGQSSEDLYDAYSTFWPIDKGLLKLKDESGFGILNIDSLRAAILYLDSERNGGNDTLRKALFESPLTSGALFANRRVTFLDAATRNLSFLTSAGFSGGVADKPEVKKIYDAVKDIVDNRLFNSNKPITIKYGFSNPNDVKITNGLSDLQVLKQLCTNLITTGFIGDRTDGFVFNNSATGAAITNISGSDIELSREFKDALFNVLILRQPKPKGLPYIYSTDGLYAGFYKLILKYSLDKDKIKGTEDKPDVNDIIRKNTNRGSASVYPDLLLPSYSNLYGARWQEFAPTLDDLGIVVPRANVAGEELRSEIAVSENDFVSPACWFYVKRNKKELRESLKRTVAGVNEVAPSLSISVPFNTQDIERLKELIATKNKESKNSQAYNKAEKTINEIITDSFTKYSKTNPAGYREDVTKVLTAGDKFEKLINTNQKILIQYKNQGSYAIPREINIPGIGAEIYRVVTKEKLLEVDQPALLDPNVEATYVTPLNREAAFLRGSAKSTEACVNSCIDQIADDHTSPERMFPAIKVYLIDRRGNDLIADDTLFNVNAIISVDITMDKDDAPVAVIRLADPLYFLQNSYFDERNVQYGDRSVNKNAAKIEKVFNSLRSADRDSFLKRYKIAQGRAVQIRMGYSSMPYNLPIVFTGRIAEISPGDELTLVCQGWKAELINRKVNFYNDDTKNWGARDLAIQAISYANPEGFGDYFPEADAQFILKNMDPMDVELALENVRRNAENVDVEGKGSRNISEGVSNWISTLFTYTSQDKKNVGFDTRLKNIWYPDTQLYSNTLGLRSLFQVMPSWLNDSWVVPLQPAWDVLKEASRHAWNCVVEVLPYDGEATIFMGHPDQPYYYTRGDSYSKKSFRKFSSEAKKQFDRGMSELINGFLSSDYYQGDRPTEEPSLVSQAQLTFALQNAVANLPTSASSYFDKTYRSLLSFIYSPNLKSFTTEYYSIFDLDFIAGDESLGGVLDVRLDITGASRGLIKEAAKAFNKSTLPSERLDQLISAGVSGNLSAYLFAVFYGLSVRQVIEAWPTIKQELPAILKDLDNAYNNPELNTKLANLVVLPKIKEQRRYYKKYFQDVQNPNSYMPRYDLQGYKFDSLYKALDEMLVAFPEFTNQIALAKAGIQDIEKESKVFFPLTAGNIVRIENLKNLNSILYGLKELVDPASFLDNQVVFTGTVANDIPSILEKLGLRTSSPTRLFEGGPDNYILDYLPIFKAFVYYFCSYALESNANVSALSKIVETYDKTRLPPNMKVFRVHHFADDTHNILSNNIVASTAEMWNTVVIEHPSPGTANNTVTADSIYTSGTLSSGINWIYWPKQEVTGVIGLQFHPGLTLANKKIKVFTELNVQTPDLAAKLACNHLAEGIKKMYRGNLALLGKHIKPHDRIVLADSYTKMVGPIEVESVVHHWNVNQGWVTNILPNAICEANPSSSVLQTAVMETTYQSIFNVVDFVSDVLTYATIIATLGAATPLAAARFSTARGLKGLMTRLLNENRLKATWNAYKSRLRKAGGSIANDWRNGARVGLIKSLYKAAGGPVNSLLANEIVTGTAKYGASMLFRHSAISSYVEIGDKAEQLPVMLTPLIFNGNPFTAGLETEDNIWAIGSFGLYYSMKEIQAAASRFAEDFWED